MDNFLKRCSSTSTIYHPISQDKKDNRISIYDNVPTPKTIDKKINQFNNSDEDEGINRRTHMLTRNKLTHHYKKCFCKIENAFLRFDLYIYISKWLKHTDPRDEIKALQSVLTLKDLELEMMNSDLLKEQACHRKTVQNFTVIQ